MSGVWLWIVVLVLLSLMTQPTTATHITRGNFKGLDDEEDDEKDQDQSERSPVAAHMAHDVIREKSSNKR